MASRGIDTLRFGPMKPVGLELPGTDTIPYAVVQLRQDNGSATLYNMNTLSPKIAGKFQVSTTVIKLIPLFLMAVLGTIAGIHSGVLVENFSQAAVTTTSSQHPLFTAVVATSFAYEGWIIATSINSELKDAKKNLPKALTFGTLFIVLTYVLYYIGLAGTVENAVMMKNGEQGAKIAFMFEPVFQYVKLQLTNGTDNVTFHRT